MAIPRAPGALTLVAIVALLTGHRISAQVAPPSRSVVIVDVTLIDVVNSTTRPHRTLVIEKGRISRVAAAASFRPPRDALIVDGAGLYVIPGLWDMHTHSGGYDNAVKAYPRLVERGILGVRDMGTPLDDLARLQMALSDSSLVGPRLVFAGPLLQGPLPFSNPVLLQIPRASAARSAVDSLRRRGASFVKIGDAVPADTWDSLRVAARAARLPFVGHVPPSISVWHATQRGQASVEHLGGRYFGILLGCSTAETELRRSIIDVIDTLVAAIRAGRDADDSRLSRAPFTRRLLATQDAGRTANLLRAFRQNHTWQVPTLAALPIRAVLADTVRFNAEDRKAAAALIARSMRLVRQMSVAGVGIMAGTDLSLSPDDLVRELELLVEAGLTPMQALQSATLNPARFLGAADSLGSVTPGMIADLVVLRANPLSDIANVSRVHLVIRGGMPVSPRR
jgi:hypothetical protein